MIITVKTMYRFGCFMAAGIFMLVGVILFYDMDNRAYKAQLEVGHIRSLQELSSSMNAITLDLHKATLSGTPAQMSAISARIWREAGNAKLAISNLPAHDISLDSTGRFLSQVGDYAMYLARKNINGQSVTAEEREILISLLAYAENINMRILEMESAVSSGQINFAELFTAQPGTVPKSKTPQITGFWEMEDSAVIYPEVIYDGLYSDGLINNVPEMIRYAPETPRETARETAARFAGLSPGDLKDGADEESHMPSYIFTGEYYHIGVTKSGGLVTYISCSRQPDEKSVSTALARETARNFLEDMGISSMREIEYETSGGVCIVSFAYRALGIICYPDVIKVGVAMDNGAIISYDAREYISNHRERPELNAEIDAAAAKMSLHPALEIKRTSLAILQTAGKNEFLAYEFICVDERGRNVKVYVNAINGTEEQIYILRESEDGIFTI